MRLQSLGLATSFITVVTLLACKETTSSSLDTENQSAAPSTLSFAKLPPGCKNVHGKVDLSPIFSVNDPFGELIGPSTGPLKGAVSSTLTSPPIPGVTPGTLVTTSSDFWVTRPYDIITSTGSHVWTFIPGSPNVSVETTQTITGGTGKYDGATGTLHLTGTAYGFIPAPTPGNTHFDLEYKGTVCT